MGSDVTYVIAEAGACGDGDLTKMLAQIDACAEAGVDAVKFQWTSDAKAMACRRGRAERDGYGAIYKKYLQWPTEWHHRLRSHCSACDRDYICTVYLPGDVETIAPYVRHFKVSSFEAQDLTLHSAVLNACRDSRLERWMLLSIGMVNDRDSEMLRLLYTDLPFVRYLHCISAYPTPFDAMCLSRIHALQLHGFSDHTAPELTMTGALAVAAGATIVEAHMRLETTDDKNPDAQHAMTPEQLTDYVNRIRMVEKGMFKRDLQCEDRMRDYRVGEPNDNTTSSHD